MRWYCWLCCCWMWSCSLPQLYTGTSPCHLGSCNRWRHHQSYHWWRDPRRSWPLASDKIQHHWSRIALSILCCLRCSLASQQCHRSQNWWPRWFHLLVMLRRDNHWHLWSDHTPCHHPCFQFGSTTVARRPCRTSSESHHSTQVKWLPATGHRYTPRHTHSLRSRPPQPGLHPRMKYSRHQPGQTNLSFRCHLPSGLTNSRQDGQDFNLISNKKQLQLDQNPDLDQKDVPVATGGVPFKAAGAGTSGVDVIDGVHGVNGDSIKTVIRSGSKLYYPLPISIAVVLHNESIGASQLSLTRPGPLRIASNDHFAGRI